MTITERALYGSVEIRREDSEFIAHATNLTIRRGGARTALGVTTDVGIMSFLLQNAEDPLQGGTFAPGQKIVVLSRDRAGKMAELYTGRVLDVGAAYPMNKGTGKLRALTRVTVVDAVKVHATTPRYGVAIPTGFETFEARIQRLAGSATDPIEPPVEGAPREVYAL